MSNHLQASPSLIGTLAQPSPSYRRSARLAVAVLIAFVSAYFALAGWFLWSAYRLVRTALHATDPFWMWIAAACAVFFGLFMLKSLFSVRNAMPDGLTELSPQEQPRLFAFLHELADAAGAPRPHRVFLSQRVNASVFYDLSLLNLILPSKKNLEIGLPLINTLPLAELRAVLAHEFGHFAQRSMAVGRWVYIAQQITWHVVHQRDRFDAFLIRLGNIDLRLRVLVWALQLVVWSIRSLVESAFRLVLLMQRALGREMELQADLVAVSLTGSDALVHALHRLHATEETWGRTQQFVHGQKARSHAVRDAYAVQHLIRERMAVVLDDGGYGDVPAVPAEAPEHHRVFREQMGHPPKMWQSHPLNHEREANAKRHYVAAAPDASSGWSLFDDAQALRERETAALVGPSETPLAPLADEAMWRALKRYYHGEQYRSRYCGVYLGREIARHAERSTALRRADSAPVEGGEALYPATLRSDVRALRDLREEHGQLQALAAGWMTAQGGRIRFRGQEYGRSELPGLVARAAAELEEIEGRLRAHDRACREWHQGVARRLGGGWEAYLDGLLAVLHYTEHTRADIVDAHGLMQNVVAVETAARLGKEGRIRIVMAANELHHRMEQVYKTAGTLVLDPKLAARIEATDGWCGMLGEFTLPLAEQDTLGQWLSAIDSWVEHLVQRLGELRGAALEQLLLAEKLMAMHARAATIPRPAPVASTIPAHYPTLLPGAERARRTTLPWWARFLRADGWLPGTARLAVAGGIVAFALGLGLQHGSTQIVVHNGLQAPMLVDIDGSKVTVDPVSRAVVLVAPADSHRVATRGQDGVLVEEFSVPDATGQNVYNIAGAAPLTEWTANYGGAAAVPERRLGAQRWVDSHADILFEEPPRTISSKRGTGSTRTVLAAWHGKPETLMPGFASDTERARAVVAHARWDDPAAPDTAAWIVQAREFGQPDMLAERLRRAPGDVGLLRLRQDLAAPERKAAVCKEDAARAAAAPGDGDLAYLALRCAADSRADPRTFRDAAARWPGNRWFRTAAAHEMLEQGEFASAVPEIEFLLQTAPAMREHWALLAARLQRLERGSGDYERLRPMSPRLRALLDVEQGSGPDLSPTRALPQLALGNLVSANVLVEGTEEQARVWRLIGASDGASEGAVGRALDTPVQQGIDYATVLPTLALALRTGRDPAPYVAAANAIFGDATRIVAFLRAVHANRPQRDCENILGAVPPDVRALAYAAAAVLQKERTPAPWRRVAKRMLFTAERPFFV